MGTSHQASRSLRQRAADRLRDAAGLTSLAARVGYRTGLLQIALPRGLGILARAIVTNHGNPSTLYRLQAACQPHKVALVHRDRSFTFLEIHREIGQIAAGLRANGVTPGSAVLLVLKNRPEMVFAQPALSRLGAAGVNASWRSMPQEIAYLANHSGARAMLFDVDCAAQVREAMRDIPLLSRQASFCVGGRAEGFPSYDELLEGRKPIQMESGEDAAVVVYTSGTTGLPKAALRKFPRDTVSGALQVISASPLRTDDVHLAVLPFYHSTAFAFTSFSHLVGAKVVILDDASPKAFLEAIEQHGITQTAVVPTLLHRVLQLGREELAHHNTGSLRAIITAGAPLSGPLAMRVMDVFGDVIYNFYGATETGLNTVATPADLRAAPGTIGKAVPGNEIRLLDDQGAEVPRGKVGEMFVRSRLMVSGYLNDEEATRASQRDGFFSVGDIAWQDEQGRYHLAGRKHDLIISGGVNVYPAEVEAVLESHPDVAEAAVVGMPDPEWGERVVAFVVPRPGVPEGAMEAVDAYCRDRLMGPKRPRKYVVIEFLPRNPTGKVIKTALREMRGGAGGEAGA